MIKVILVLLSTFALVLAAAAGVMDEQAKEFLGLLPMHHPECRALGIIFIAVTGTLLTALGWLWAENRRKSLVMEATAAALLDAQLHQK